MGVPLELHLHKNADLPRRIQLDFKHGAKAKLVVGDGARIQPYAHIRLAGTLDIGPWSEIRTLCSLHVNGELRFVGRNIICRGSLCHTDSVQVWGFGASTAEYVSVADSEHRIDGSPIHLWSEPVAVEPVTIGTGAFLAAKSFVTMGTTIGDGALIGANAVVTRDVPPGVVAAGVPARVVRTLPYIEAVERR
jgi:acetyltransferase-like isoleucine patch superfamily enzyme